MQRPSVILRGAEAGAHFGVDTVYLISFQRIAFEGGGVQYQQVAEGDQFPGFYDFGWCVQEENATPLLDVQVAPWV